MGAAKHLLHYPAGSIDFNITYLRRGFRLTVLTDAYLGNNSGNRKSTSSYVMLMYNGPVSFNVGMQG